MQRQPFNFIKFLITPLLLTVPVMLWPVMTYVYSVAFIMIFAAAVEQARMSGWEKPE